MNNLIIKQKKVKLIISIIFIICILTSCVQTKDSKNPIASATPMPTPSSTVKQLTKENNSNGDDSSIKSDIAVSKSSIKKQDKSTKLSINQAIDLACKKLDISNNKIKYVATDTKSGIYEVSVNDYFKMNILIF